MSRRARHNQTVSLFPFLAVLLCAMGALLVLLVVTTRQIRDEAIRQAATGLAAPSEPEPVERQPEREYEWPRWEITLGDARELERRQLPAPPPPPLLAPKPVFVKRETDPPPPDLSEELKQLREQIETASTLLADRHQTIEAARKQHQTLLAEIEKRGKVLKQANQAIETFQSQQRQFNRELMALKPRAESMTRRLRQLESETETLAEQPRITPNILKVVPYDGQQGTTRRPILIECAGNAIRFVPEDIVLREQDLVGFSLSSNPLLTGVLAAEEYWIQRDKATGNFSRPYVLLVVRPDGIPAYYAARQLLQNYKQPSGYELLTADQKLALPEVDPDARQQIAQAVQAQLLERGGTPSVARTPFPKTDPGLLERLRRGDETLGSASGSASAQPGAGRSSGGSGDRKRFKYVQTSQGLKMVPIDDANLKRFDTSAERQGSKGEDFRSVRSGRNSPDADSSASAAGKPQPLPAMPDGSRIKSLPAKEQFDKEPSGLTSRQDPLPTAGSTSREETKSNDPAQAPDAWTPLLQQRAAASAGGSNSQDRRAGQTSPSAGSSSAENRRGMTSPIGNAGSLAFRRTIKVILTDTQLRVADRNPVAIPDGISTAQLMSATISELRHEFQSWKEPPEQFHWKPVVKFVVYPGGNQYFERLRPAFEERGLSAGVEFQFADPDSDWRPTQP